MVVRRVGKYEVGRTIGEGNFAKVKFAQNTETGESVAMKVLDRATIIKHNMVDQIKREISIMKLVRHPHVVRLHEVLASRTKIYIILEYITGGELFDKIIRHGKLSEAESRRYFQQLIDGVGYCHSKGVYHRDLKPENLLLDSQGNLKISDFGLSALPAQGVSLLRTTCGTPNYVAPEVEIYPLDSKHKHMEASCTLRREIKEWVNAISHVIKVLGHKGYNGAVADAWSCGVILYVLLAGYLPFDEIDLSALYSKVTISDHKVNQVMEVPLNDILKYCTEVGTRGVLVSKIDKAEFSFPSWFSDGSKSLIRRILDPNPETRMRMEDIRNDEWFKKNYVPVSPLEAEEVNLDDIYAVFDESEVNEQSRNEELGPLNLNAFDLIILSEGLNLAALFDRRQDFAKHITRFLSRKSAKVVLSSMEVVAQSMGFKTHIRNYKMRVEGLTENRTAHLSVVIEIFEIAPSFLMVDIQRASGDVTDYLKFNKNFHSKLDEIIWKPATERNKTRFTRKSKR